MQRGGESIFFNKFHILELLNFFLSVSKVEIRWTLFIRWFHWTSIVRAGWRNEILQESKMVL